MFAFDSRQLFISSILHLLIILSGLLLVVVSAVDVSFEDGYAGFFLKSGHEETSDVTTGTLLNRDHFIVLHPSNRAAMVRVGYGPFTAKQTVPYPSSSLPLVSLNQSSLDSFARWPSTTDVTAYLVTKEVKREQPVLRVLFHFTQSGRRDSSPSSSAASASSVHNYQNLCVVLAAVRDGRRQVAVCSPSSRDTTCLAEVIVPHSWWPPLQRTIGTKVQKNVMAVEYAVVVDAKRSECNEAHIGGGGGGGSAAAVQWVTTPLWQVPISPDPVRYSEMMENGSLQILVPRNPVYGHSKIYIPVFVRSADLHSVNIFVMRARVKSGLKILEAETSMSNFWTIQVDLNLKGTVATVTAFAKEGEGTEQPKFDEDFVEAFAWLLEVEDGVDRPGHITWTVRFVRVAGKVPRVTAQEDGMRMTTEVEVQKDDIQTALLVSKTWELVNTAVLNGKQVSQPAKVFFVSQAGKVADVTLQSSCHSVDESILKVSPSCTSVYLDGSEIRGSHNATVIVKYGTFTGYAHFTVWVPELPLDIVVGDARLSQIRNWKAPKEFARKLLPRTREEEVVARSKLGRVLRGGGDEKQQQRVLCRLRYQQTPVSVYARFFAVDDKSGRESYLLNRKSAFRVTELVQEHLRIADPRIATLKGRIVQGYSTGRTEVQILSPMTGRVIGATELRVAKDKEMVTGLRVSVVTGLQLSIKGDYDVANGFVAETAITHRLTAKYQEGLLDIDIRFSDGTSTPLSHVAESDFQLSVDVRDRHVVALAPMASPYHPRVIALGDGNGTLDVSVEIPEGCRRHGPKPLAQAAASVVVHLRKDGDKVGGVQNDDNHRFERGRPGKFGRGGRLDAAGTALLHPNDASSSSVVQLDSSGGGGSRDPLVQARQNHHHPDRVIEMSRLEVGMYALLGIFCLAIVVFVTSCAVYAVRFHKKQEHHGGGGGGGFGYGCSSDPVVANAHDWVWLGRATLERGKSVGSHQFPRPMDKSSLSSSSKATGCAASTLAVPANNNNNNNNGRVGPPTFEVVSIVNENADNFDDDDDEDSRPPTPPQRSKAHVVANPLAAASSSSAAGPLKTFRGGGASQDDDSTPPPVPPHAVVAAAARRKVPEAAARSSSQHLPPWTAANCLVNYDVLVDYFDNLKESNA